MPLMVRDTLYVIGITKNLISVSTLEYKGYVVSFQDGRVYIVYFNLVQLFTTNKFSIKEQKRYNGKYTHYTEIFPLETQTEKTNIFYIHSPHTLFTIQYTYRIQ
jgi:hypothetical protein